jgi:two-component system chemotaxis sensor kinase CheA
VAPKDPYIYFRVEARELLDGMSQAVLELEKSEQPKAMVARVLRNAHTLKGAARVVRCPNIAQLAHKVEDQLSPHRDVRGRVERSVVDQALELLDAIQKELAALDAPAVKAEPKEEAAPEPRESPAGPAGMVVKLELKELERLQESAQAILVQLTALKQAGEKAMRSGVERACRDLGQLQDDVNHLRLFEAGQLLGILERSVRDAARSRGLEIQFLGEGGATRLDSHVLATLQAGLLHLVRNAVAHGIESPQERVAAGKPAAGRITVRFEGQGLRARVTCSDDGRGVDLEAVRRVLVSRGIVTAEAAAGMTSDGLLQQLFSSGISTSATVTELAGRGVGLDVVRDVLNQLQGEAEIKSELGRGTTVQMRVPVSLFSFPAIAVGVGSEKVFVPLGAVTRARQFAPGEVAAGPDGQCVLFESEVIPFVPLTNLLEWPAAVNRGTLTTVVVRHGTRRAVLQVDRILEVAEVVMQSLPAPVAPDALVAGAIIDSEGNPLLVLDPAGIVEAAGRTRPLPEEMPVRPRPPILIVDDSLTTRMLEQSILEAAGYQVDMATSAEEALVKARAGSFGLFIVDVEMPGMNGFEFVSLTRTDPVLGKVPAILVTSLSSRADRARGMQAGAVAYITKDEFEQTLFLDTIAGLIG